MVWIGSVDSQFFRLGSNLKVSIFLILSLIGNRILEE